MRADQRSNGGRWNDLGVYTFAAGQALVVLGNDTAGFPVADAVRIEEVPAGGAGGSFDQTVDNTSAQAVPAGSWLSSSFVPGYQGSDYLWTTAGDGSASVEWSFQIPAPGSYEVLAWWSAPFSTRSPDAPFTVQHAAGSTTRTVDQRANGGRWNSLGTYTFAAGQARVVLSNAATRNPVADAVRIREVGASGGLSADFAASPRSGQAPLQVAFSDRSVGGGAPIESWFWEFGDGSTSSERNPTHVYGGSGRYSVSLTVRSAGRQDTLQRPAWVDVSNSSGIAFDFGWPIDESQFVVLQSFGNQRIERGSSRHSGTDFGVYGSAVEVRAIANGWVEKVAAVSGFGNTVMLRHVLPDGETLYSWYNHLAQAGSLTIGQFVPRGARLGVVGETGWTPSGIHLHLELKRRNDVSGGYLGDLSQHLDPYEYILSRLVYRPEPTRTCLDGTPADRCSVTRPLRCVEGGHLVENSLKCGCDRGVPQSDNSCSKSEDWIVLDNGDPGFSSGGGWERSTEVMGFYGSDYLKSRGGQSEATAVWRPTVPTTGYYTLYGWWRDRFSTDRSTRDRSASVLVDHAGGRTNLTVDMSDYRKGWKALGTFRFEAGTSHAVVVFGSLNGDVVADAFALAPQ